MRVLAVVYGVVCYAIFFLTFLYAIGFVAGAGVPKTIDGGAVGALGPSLLVDTLLLGIFAVQHSLMARPRFKGWWTRIVPQPVERSTYVLFSSAALVLLFWQWRPLPQPVWRVENPNAAGALLALAALGWLTVLTSTFLISHFDLFGLRQVWAYRTRREIPPSEFRTPLFYRLVRHPIYLGFIIAFWATPSMSLGRLWFALASTAYVLIGIQLEERDLVGVFGDAYRSYRRRVPMLLPLPRFGRKPTSAPPTPGERRHAA
jgi:protein-S-isoprenylcysteine O-methyltransferase Ste14